MAHITIAGIFAMVVYAEMVGLPIFGAVWGFFDEGWRGIFLGAWEAYQIVLEMFWAAAPVVYPICLACKHPMGSPGMKVLLFVAFVQNIPSELYRVLSVCLRYTLSSYLDDWIICTVSTISTIAYVAVSIYAFKIGWAEIDFIANIQVWETLKAAPMSLFRFIWAFIKLPVTVWILEWWSPYPLGIPPQDEETGHGSVAERGFIKEKNDLSKQVTEDHAALAEQDKDLQEKILEGIEA